MNGMIINKNYKANLYKNLLFLNNRDYFIVGDKMASQLKLNKFNEIYDKTPLDVLKFVVIK